MKLCQLALLFVLLDAFLGSAFSASTGGRIFAKGSFGTVDAEAEESSGLQGLLPIATSKIASILQSSLGATGQESFQPVQQSNKIVKDKAGHKHVRFEQTYQGIEVVDTALVMHLDENGTVYAVNGEFVVDGSVDTKVRVSCDTAFTTVLDEPLYAAGNATWLSKCERKVVLDKYGVAHMAWVRMVGYQPMESRPYQKTYLYASVVTGAIVAIRPQVPTAMALMTKDCRQSELMENCVVVSTSSNAIDTNDDAIDDAHNYARLVYDFYLEWFGRDSIDGFGMTIISNVHYGFNVANAFWDGTAMKYGDGDGFTFSALSRDADIVGHELTHGVTQYTSNLIYQDESGALNEAFSDVFGAAFERSLGASVSDTWKCGENVYTPWTTGDALRYMANPTQSGDDYDWFPDRYQGLEDNGGVHWNSGIMNLAFVLMVQGGKHPRGLSSIMVPPIDPDFDKSMRQAAEIFYMAQTACLTPMSGFAEVRQCTIIHAGDAIASVQAAWQAVGVAYIASGEPITGLSSPIGGYLETGMTGIPPGSTVECSTTGPNGDADLFVELQGINFGEYDSCSSISESSNEVCSVGPFNTDISKAWIRVDAYASFSDLSLTCTKTSTAIALRNGVAQTGVNAMPSSELVLSLYNIPPDTATTCQVDASRGIPSVYSTFMTDDGDITLYDPCYVPSDAFAGSSTQCIMTSPSRKVNLYMILYADTEGFSGLSVTCSFQSVPNMSPVTVPTRSPTMIPVRAPTIAPTKAPARAPTIIPTKAPARAPTIFPTKAPSKLPVLSCKPKRARCRKTKQCCGARLVCDGPSATKRTCKRAKRAGSTCRRHSQCNVGARCKRGRCT